MKKLSLSFVASSLAFSFSASAQDQHPAPVAVIAPPPSAPAAAAVVPAAALAAVAAAPQNKPMRTATIGGDAFFDTNKATFRKEAQPELEKISANVRRVTSVEAVQITGYTDNTGVDPSKITILGKGRGSPIADNATKEGRAKNRRVEVMVKGAVEGQ
jgi:OOP family OmpA-OmpF porin